MFMSSSFNSLADVAREVTCPGKMHWLHSTWGISCGKLTCLDISIRRVGVGERLARVQRQQQHRAFAIRDRIYIIRVAVCDGFHGTCGVF